MSGSVVVIKTVTARNCSVTRAPAIVIGMRSSPFRLSLHVIGPALKKSRAYRLIVRGVASNFVYHIILLAKSDLTNRALALVGPNHVPRHLL